LRQVADTVANSLAFSVISLVGVALRPFLEPNEINTYLMNQFTSFQTTTSYTTAPVSSSAAILVNSGLTDPEGARNVARKILDTYDRDRNGHIDSIEVVPMIVDAYKSFNRVFSPSRADIESYLKVLDRNGDGRVTIQDLEELCMKYLTGR
jgi:Ca2+-binding EF-hand superfamily protein